MFFRLSEDLTNQFIRALRDFWSTHPLYKDLVENIQGKYSFNERPQYGIVVKPSGGSGVHLSADNYVGRVISHVSLHKVGQNPGFSLEWIIEDRIAIQNNGGRFPTIPGVYYIDVIKSGSNYQFYVDRLLEVRGEALMLLSPTVGQVLAGAIHKGSLFIVEKPTSFVYREGEHYDVDYTNGRITFRNPVGKNVYLSVDYKYPGETTGPHELPLLGANHTAIPGVVLAFGNRVVDGDKMAIVVAPHRSPVADEYGGRWETSIEIDIISRDESSCREMTDRSAIYLWGVARSHFSDLGIELKDLSIGGEAEEIYDETGDDYYYNASLSCSVESDWSIRKPLEGFLREAVLYNTDVPVDQAEMLVRISKGFELRPFTDPYYVRNNIFFEKVT